jgi:hypothetical protein
MVLSSSAAEAMRGELGILVFNDRYQEATTTVIERAKLLLAN